MGNRRRGDFGGLSDRFASPSERASSSLFPTRRRSRFTRRSPARFRRPQLTLPERAARRERTPKSQRSRPVSRPPGPPREPSSRSRRAARSPVPGSARSPGPGRTRRATARFPSLSRPRVRARWSGSPVEPTEPPSALPSFITAGPRILGPQDARESAARADGRKRRRGEPGGRTGRSRAEPSTDGRFPGRGRRRRLRSPYGFRAAAEPGR